MPFDWILGLESISGLIFFIFFYFLNIAYVIFFSLFVERNEVGAGWLVLCFWPLKKYYLINWSSIILL